MSLTMEELSGLTLVLCEFPGLTLVFFFLAFVGFFSLEEAWHFSPKEIMDSTKTGTLYQVL